MDKYMHDCMDFKLLAPMRSCIHAFIKFRLLLQQIFFGVVNLLKSCLFYDSLTEINFHTSIFYKSSIGYAAKQRAQKRHF